MEALMGSLLSYFISLLSSEGYDSHLPILHNPHSALPPCASPTYLWLWMSLLY